MEIASRDSDTGSLGTSYALIMRDKKSESLNERRAFDVVNAKCQRLSRVRPPDMWWWTPVSLGNFEPFEPQDCALAPPLLLSALINA